MNTSRSIGGRSPIFLMLIAGLLFPRVSHALTGTESGYDRTQQEIRQIWNLMKPLYSGGPYERKPVIRSPFAPGAVERKFAEDALRTLNFMRYLADLPPTVVLDTSLMDQAQYGAVLLASTDDFAHELPKPAAMPEEFYRKAIACTTTSNISRGFPTLEAAVRNGYARDDDEYNLETLGHRRWMLNPRFGKTGFGFAEANHYGMTRAQWDSTMQVHDFSGSDVEYDYIAWPSPGNFPREFFDADDPWSVTLNPALYHNPDFRSVRVALVRLRDGKRWVLDASDSKVSSTAEFFTVNLERYGVGNAVIFRPSPSEIGMNGRLSDAGDPMVEQTEYRVEITGLKRIDGLAASLTYSVTFFDLEPEKAPDRAPAPEVASGRK